MDHSKFIVRIRAIIVHDDKLLVIRNSANDFYCLPGGKLELGETIHEGLKREITEELGIEPKIGRLLFINNYIENNGNQSIEFIFEVTNAEDYLDEKNLKGTHSFEFNDIYWAGKNDNKTILPKQIQDYLNNGTLLSDTVRFLSDK
jgi:ADP-ribose pyrophosphatase YjhB (NUDIX family)